MVSSVRRTSGGPVIPFAWWSPPSHVDDPPFKSSMTRRPWMKRPRKTRRKQKCLAQKEHGVFKAGETTKNIQKPTAREEPMTRPTREDRGYRFLGHQKSRESQSTTCWHKRQTPNEAQTQRYPKKMPEEAVLFLRMMARAREVFFLVTVYW